MELNLMNETLVWLKSLGKALIGLLGLGFHPAYFKTAPIMNEREGKFPSELKCGFLFQMVKRRWIREFPVLFK